MALPLQSIVSNILQSNQTDWRKRLVQEWASIVGDLHTKMRLERIGRDDMLIIGVYDIHWMHELHMLSPLIIQTINEKLCVEVIQKIRFVVIDTEQRYDRKITHKKEIAQKNRISLLTQEQQAALARIQDPALQAALAQFWKI